MRGEAASEAAGPRHAHECRRIGATYEFIQPQGGALNVQMLCRVLDVAERLRVAKAPTLLVGSGGRPAAAADPGVVHREPGNVDDIISRFADRDFIAVSLKTYF
jgi:hypothetical protein